VGNKGPIQVEVLSGRWSPLPKSRAESRDRAWFWLEWGCPRRSPSTRLGRPLIPTEERAAASQALGIEDLDTHFLQLRTSIGPPWGKNHKLAMAAAVVAATAR
jgi:hypothetical protein